MSESSEIRRRGQHRTSINLPEPLVAPLRAAAEKRGDSFAQALREAIALKLYVEDALESGSKLLIEKPDGSLREIVFMP